MIRNNEICAEIDEEEYRKYLPYDSIEEMEYQARKPKSENNNASNVANVAKAVIVLACIGLVCTIIDYYVEKI